MIDDFCFFHPRNPELRPVQTTLNKRAIKVIVAAIQEAWTEIETFRYWKSMSFDAQHYHDEDELTTKLAEILNDKLSNGDGGPFRKETFQAVVRDGKQTTASVSSTEQMPDLTFRMIKRMAGEDCDESAFFVETKLVDMKGGCRQYVVEGLYRFVSGKYAPRMTAGLMLGYGTPSFSTAEKHLPDYFSKAKSPEAILCNATIVASDVSSECFASTHARTFPCPPDFLALHLWLVRPFVYSQGTE